MRKIFSLLLIFIAPCFSANAQMQLTDVNEAITEQRIEYLIRSLSSDEMKGRRTFTPSIEKAAGFIAAQFKEAGLESLDNETDFLQCFDVYTLRPDKKNLQLNGTLIDSSSFFVSANHTQLKWEDLSEVNVVRFSEEDNFRASFARVSNNTNEHTVVLIDRAHQSSFRRYSEFFSGLSRTMQLDHGPGILFLMTDEESIESGSFHFTQSVETREACNVAGKITGTSKKDEYVIFSAHFDHIGVLEPVNGDSIANGADDNASGTTAVITLAEYYKNLGPQERTLIFVAFTAEEIGGYGSRYFSWQLEPDQVAAMFNIEMIGKPSKFGPNTAFLTGFEKSDMGEILQSDMKDTPYQIYPDPYPEQNLFYRSDNATLARLGVPAHTISSVQIDRDINYHTVSDELGTLNVEHMTNMIRAIVLSSRSIVSGSDTPTRVNPESLN